MKLTTLPKGAKEMLTNQDPQEVQAVKIQAESKVKQAKTPKGTVAPATSLRERILSISLFPNPYNKSNVYRYGID
jgi:hypothetical protein